MTVGFFSPLPPARTGVADYSAALLTALRKCGRVEIAPRDADMALYHLGNNHLHREIYRLAIEKPGIAVLHDAVLNHFLLGTLDRSAYIEEFIYNYGEWHRSLAEELWANRARSAADARYFDYPMLRRVVERSLAVIVHNPAAATAVLRHRPDARVIEIPHLFVAPELPDPVDTIRFRAEQGLGPRTLLAGVFGHLRESKRLCAILRAMERVWSSGANAKLLVQGAFASSDLERAISPLIRRKPRILRAPALPEPEFWRWAAATDVCLNLRYPRAAETSGIAIRMMGIGTPVIFSSGEEISRFPPNSCLSVDTGVDEEAMLADYLVWLATDRHAVEEIGCRAAAHIKKEHAIEKVAAQYWNLLEAALRHRARPALKGAE